MRGRQITFLLSGLFAGLICVAQGLSAVSLLTLTWGVGPMFFLAVIAAILVTRAWHPLKADFLRYSAGAVLCFITYMIALMAFFAVAGFSPEWLRFSQSDRWEKFGLDVWLGLIAAGVIGAGGIALFTTLLTGKWSKALLQRLMLVGLLTIVLTFIVNLPFQNYWSFLGVLFTIGNSLFCWAVGVEILQNSEAPSDASLPEPSSMTGNSAATELGGAK